MNRVLVLTKNYSNILTLTNRDDIPRTQLTHVFDIDRVRGMDRGMKYVVLGTFSTTPKERHLIEEMKVQSNIEIQPDDVREAVLGDGS